VNPSRKSGTPVWVWTDSFFLLSRAIEGSSARIYQSGLNKFREFIQASSGILGVVPPQCESSQDLRALSMAPSVVAAFLTFCTGFGLAS